MAKQLILAMRMPGHVQPVGRPGGTWMYNAMKDVKDMGQPRVELDERSLFYLFLFYTRFMPFLLSWQQPCGISCGLSKRVSGLSKQGQVPTNPYLAGSGVGGARL